MKLYRSPVAPFTARFRIALAYKGLAAEDIPFSAAA
jgi:glutathione S-transferase